MFYNFLSSFLSGNKEVLRRVYKKAFAGIVLFLFSFDAFGHHTYGSPLYTLLLAVCGLQQTI